MGVVGAVVGALIMGATWLVVGSQAGSFDGSGRELTAPAKIGDYGRFADAEINQGAKGKSNVERTTKWNARSAERLSDSYDGAAATVETYSDGRYLNVFALKAVRATSPFPVYVPYVDPEYLRLVRPQNEEKRFGEVSCALFNQPTMTGKEPEEDSTRVITCMRTEPGLTVEITNVTGDLNSQPERVVSLVNDAWQQLA